MAPPLLMSSSQSSLIYIFNCVRRLRETEITESLCVCVCVCVCASVCVSQEMQFERKYPEEENSLEQLGVVHRTYYLWENMS
jgi:hypothetical protein